MKNILILLVLCLSINAFAQNIEYINSTPNSQIERSILYKDYNSGLDTNFSPGNSGRVTDGYSYYYYKIPTKNLTSVKFDTLICNRYSISLSNNDINYTEISNVKNFSGGKNLGVVTIDATKYLPADYIYIRFSTSDPDGGYGGYSLNFKAYGDKNPTNLEDYKNYNKYMKITVNSPAENYVIANNTNTTTQKDATNSFSTREVKDNSFFIYKIYTKDLKYLTFFPLFSNKALISISKDSKNWSELLKTDNKDKYYKPNSIEENRISATSFLPSEYIYIKFQPLNKGDEFIFKGMTIYADKDNFTITKTNLKAPIFKYNPDELSITAPKVAFNYKLLIKNNENDIIGYYNVESNKPLSQKLKFPKVGKYSLYVFTHNKFISKTSLNIDNKMLEEITLDLTAPIYYLGENVKVYTKIPARIKVKTTNIQILKDKQPITAKISKEKNYILVSNLKTGEYKIVFSVNNTKIEKIFLVLDKKSDPDIVTITKNGYIKINNKPFAPMIMFLGVKLEETKAQGFNVTLNGIDISDGSTDILKSNLVLGNTKILDDAKANNMKVLVHMCNFFRNEANDIESLKLVVSALKNHPAVFGWYIGDEPSGSGIYASPEELKVAYDTIKEIDKNHPVVLLDFTPSKFSEYGKACDIFASDPYPIPDGNINQVADWAEKTYAASQTNSALICLQGQGKPFLTRHPTFEEQKQMLDMALENGAQSIGWWCESTLLETDYFNKMNELTTHAKDYILKNFK